MPETPTAAALVIPDKSVFALDTADRSSLLTSIDSVIAIAAPVVAAELRRIAGDFAYDGFPTAARKLRARADALDPPAQEA